MRFLGRYSVKQSTSLPKAMPHDKIPFGYLRDFTWVELNKIPSTCQCNLYNCVGCAVRREIARRIKRAKYVKIFGEAGARKLLGG
jgi:hypothetical protein